jgi:dCTP deaminase
MELGNIKIDPRPDGKQIGANSIDLRLGDRLKVYAAQLAYIDALPHTGPSGDRVTGRLQYPEPMVLDTRKANETVDMMIPPDGIVLVPTVLYLGVTLEHTETFGFVPRLDGRSSVGRLGVEIHRTAGYGDNNFRGRWTLELSCLTPVRVHPGERICQINYVPIEGELKDYAGKYQGADDVQASRKYLDE